MKKGVLLICASAFLCGWSGGCQSAEQRVDEAEYTSPVYAKEDSATGGSASDSECAQ